jgi:hypothetical protein
MYRLFPEIPLPDPGLDELFAEALRRADAEFGAMPGLVGTQSKPAHSGPFDSLLCSMVVWAVIEGRSVQAPAWSHRRLA